MRERIKTKEEIVSKSKIDRIRNRSESRAGGKKERGEEMDPHQPFLVITKLATLLMTLSIKSKWKMYPVSLQGELKRGSKGERTAHMSHPCAQAKEEKDMGTMGEDKRERLLPRRVPSRT